MATLEITSRTLKVIGAPEPDGEWWSRWIKSFFSEPPAGQEDQHLQLYSLIEAESTLIPGLAPFNLEWFITQGFRSRKFWTLTLVLKNHTTKVISSLDYPSIKSAFDKVEAALNTPDGFSASLTIENSNIVIDSYVGRDVRTNVGDGKANKT